jgi:predicted TPR repeat methyltransferase
MSSTPRSYFQSMYAQACDPWNFETSEYEHRKYELTMAALPRQYYLNAFEPGCSIGVLSEKLASRCAHVLATDIVDSALDTAKERLRSSSNVKVERRSIPRQWPEGDYDLVVLSEIAYYFDSLQLREIMRRVMCTTRQGAHVIGVHWRGETNYPLTGDRAHEIIGGTFGLSRLVHYEESSFALDVWERYL